VAHVRNFINTHLIGEKAGRGVYYLHCHRRSPATNFLVLAVPRIPPDLPHDFECWPVSFEELHRVCAGEVGDTRLDQQLADFVLAKFADRPLKATMALLLSTPRANAPL
jgi:hypothetical protein